MRVVEVCALRDYEGVQWTRLFTSVEEALDWCRTVDQEEWAGVDDVSVAWVGVGEEFFERVLSFGVTYCWGEETATFTQWDAETKKSVKFAF